MSTVCKGRLLGQPTPLCCRVNPITKCPACKISTCADCHEKEWPSHPTFDVEDADEKCPKAYHHVCPRTGLIVHKDSTKDDVQIRLDICKVHRRTDEEVVLAI